MTTTMLLVTKLRNDDEKMMMIQAKNSIMMILFAVTMKMRIVTNEMCRRSKFDARMSMQQEQDD